MLYEKFKHEQINNCTLVNGDCLDVMNDMIEEGVKVDAIIINKEVWKPVLKLYSYKNTWEIDKEYIFNYGECFISEKGRVYRNNNIVKNKPDNNYNVFVCLNKKRFKIHQIVMQTFYPEGVKDFMTVDHIDKNDRLNNSLQNLRWADRNTQYSNRENKKYKYKKILCHQNNKIYNSCQEAEIELNLVKNTVSRVARGDRQSIHGYTFEYI